MANVSGTVTVVLAVIGLEALGVPVIGTIVDLLGQLLEALITEIAYGVVDFFNPLNWF